MPSASASSARSRIQVDLDRQRSTPALDPSLRSRKEVLRQLRTGETEGLTESERLRRLRISQANKGKAPWNVGRKHTPEVIEKIRQGTFKAMRDPMMKQKLKAAHEPQIHTAESRAKISRGVMLHRMKREGVDIDSLTPEQVEELLKQRKAGAAARYTAKLARRAARLKAARALDRAEGKSRDVGRPKRNRPQPSVGFVESLRSGDVVAAAATAAAAAAEPSAAQPSRRKATPKAPTAQRESIAAARKRAAAEAAAAAEEARAGQLKRALTLVMKLEQALGQCYSHQKATGRTASAEEKERVAQVVANAQEQLLRAKGQVARLQQGAPVSSALSPEESDTLSRIMTASGAAAGRPELARFKRALAADRNGPLAADRNGVGAGGADGVAHDADAADAVLDIEAEHL